MKGTEVPLFLPNESAFDFNPEGQKRALKKADEIRC